MKTTKARNSSTATVPATEVSLVVVEAPTPTPTPTPTHVNQFVPIVRKDGKDAGRRMSFLPHGAATVAAARKELRLRNYTNKEARDAIAAYLSGNEAKIERVKARTMLDSYLESGFNPASVKENAKGDKVTFSLERHLTPAQVEVIKEKEAQAKVRAMADKAIADGYDRAVAAMKLKGLSDEEIEAAFAE